MYIPLSDSGVKANADIQIHPREVCAKSFLTFTKDQKSLGD